MTVLKTSSSKRKTIAVLAAQLNRVWGGEFISGVMDAARALDANVVCFVGGRPETNSAPASGNPSYGFYDLVRTGHYDGILLAADVGHGLSSEGIQKFCSAFAPTPLVSFAMRAKNTTAFVADNDGGMRAVVSHLIKVHGCKRIAFIRGPAGQEEADQRYRAYQEELRAHKIRFEESLVVEGDFSPESGRAAVRTLLDERGMRLQAIVAANDRMAFGAMEALQQRGIQVPDSIALTGFDDVSEAQSLGVPLTTVHQSFYGTGRQVFEALMKRIAGETLPPVNIVPAKLVVRWSCGCLPESVKKAVVLSKEVAQTGRLENKRDAAVRALFGAAGISEDDPARMQYRDVFGRTWDAFLAGLGEVDNSEAFLKLAQSTVEVLQQFGHEATTWHNVLSTFRKYALGGITDHTVMLRAENLFQQARMLVGELSQRAQAVRRLQFVQQEESLANFGFSMAPAMSLEEIGEAISKHFPVLGLERWYVMYQGDSGASGASKPEDHRLLMQYEGHEFQILQGRSATVTGRLIPHSKTPWEHRHSAVVMPLVLAGNRFGFMWAETGPKDWDVYVRVKNLLSSALLRTMLVQQRERAQKEVERLLKEARDRAVELARARDAAENAAAQNAQLFQSEQARRRGAEALARSSRLLSSLSTVEKLPSQILEQLQHVLLCERAFLAMEGTNGVPVMRSQRGFAKEVPIADLNLKINHADFYQTVVRRGEPLIVRDVNEADGWEQSAWMPRDRSWLGVPLFSKDNVIGLLALARERESFTEDDALLATTFAMQAMVAMENARLYDELTGINQMMEDLVAQRVDELKNAYKILDQHDKNKSAFIQVAAHELRTPLTVIKGYLGMLKANEAIQKNSELDQTIDGVARGTERLHQIVTSMLDVARLDNQVVTPNIEPVSLGLMLRLVHKDYAQDLALRNLTFTLEDSVKNIPPVLGDTELLKKALDHVVVNAIKYTPDGGSITVSGQVVQDPKLGGCAEIRVKDTGIGIDREHHEIIFEKLFQLGKVELHSSSRTNYKGGGAGLGLAIASGIIKSLKGTIWVESAGHDEVNFPGSTFFIRLPLAK